ncbi:hypothetical protein BJV77DRAFT_790317 [Russula vinacea]|nr:hypothetical protein BJV77DRAFT_790317 [Russula vinacea]
MTDNDVLHDSQRPFSLRYPSSLSSKQRQVVYQGQVRAFLEASEIVEMEEGVLDDILHGFGGFDHEAGDCVAAEQISIPVRKSVQDAAGNIELPLPHGFTSTLAHRTTWILVGRNNKSRGCLLISNNEESSLSTGLGHADHYCTGLTSFVKEYVVSRAIPIPELLCAFDVYLVGRWELAVYIYDLMHLASVKNYKGRSRQHWYIFFKSSFRENCSCESDWLSTVRSRTPST